MGTHFPIHCFSTSLFHSQIISDLMDQIVFLPAFTCSKLTTVNTRASNFLHLILVILFLALNMGGQVISMNPCKVNTLAFYIR